MLGLPTAITTCLFDLDGVLTKTAVVHSAAWAETFNEYLKGRAALSGEPFVAFSANDYNAYVDGKKRADGVRDFLASRGIVLPEGDALDAAGAETVYGIGNRKNELVLALIERDGVEVYEGSRRFVQAALAAGLRTGVVSSSANTEQVLDVTGLAPLFQVRVDGVVAKEEELPGKPAPDTFLAAARSLGAEPAQAAVFEDALAGVAAGRAGDFGFVVGVDRVGQAEALREHGADLVVQDLEELL
jgi:beta-phosphoglucomutase family hydrolase